MTKEEINEVEVKLKEYLDGKPAHPNMLVFSELNKLNRGIVAFVIRTSSKLGLAEPQKEFLLGTFLKKVEPEDPQAAPIEKESFADFSKKRKKRIRQEFAKDPNLKVQDYLVAHPTISEAVLRNILDRKTWLEHYDRKLPIWNWDELIPEFRSGDKTVDEFCEEKGISLAVFRKHITKEEWEQRKEFVRGPNRVIDWDAMIETLRNLPGKKILEFCKEQDLNPTQFRKRCPKDLLEERDVNRDAVWEERITAMKDSGLSYQEYCKRNGVNVQNFRNHCDKDTLEEYDEGRRIDLQRVALFDPKITVKENAEKLGVTQQYMSVWVNSKLKELSPEKFKEMLNNRQEKKKSAEDIRIEELEAKLEATNKAMADMESNYLSKIDALMDQINALSSKNGALQAGQTSLRTQLQAERQKNIDLAKKIRAFADSLTE
jgi:hypothetical protein